MLVVSRKDGVVEFDHGDDIGRVESRIPGLMVDREAGDGAGAARRFRRHFLRQALRADGAGRMDPVAAGLAPQDAQLAVGTARPEVPVVVGEAGENPERLRTHAGRKIGRVISRSPCGTRPEGPCHPQSSAAALDVGQHARAFLEIDDGGDVGTARPRRQVVLADDRPRVEGAGPRSSHSTSSLSTGRTAGVVETWATRAPLINRPSLLPPSTARLDVGRGRSYRGVLKNAREGGDGVPATLARLVVQQFAFEAMVPSSFLAVT